MYEKLGRMMGRSYEETVQVSFSFLVKILSPLSKGEGEGRDGDGKKPLLGTENEGTSANR